MKQTRACLGTPPRSVSLRTQERNNRRFYLNLSNRLGKYSKPTLVVKVQHCLRLKSQHEASRRASADADAGCVDIGQRPAVGSTGATSVASRG